MKPSDAELKDAIRSAEAYLEIGGAWHPSNDHVGAFVELAKAELQRRAAPASVPAELPVAYVYQKFLDELVKYPNTPQEAILFQTPFGVHNVPLYLNPQSAAYGREQAQTQEPPTC